MLNITHHPNHRVEENIIKLVQETQKSRKQAVKSLWNAVGNITFFCICVPLLIVGFIFLFFNIEISYPFIINSLIWMVLTFACKMKERFDKHKAIKLKTNGISHQGRVVRICPVHWIRVGNYITSRIECIYVHNGEEKIVMSGIYLLTAFDKN